MKYLSAQQKIQQLDKLASQLNKVNLYSLAASASASAFDLAKQVNDALNKLLNYNYQSFSPTDTDSSTYKIISTYINQLKTLQPKLNQDNLKVMLPMIVEIVEYFRNNLIVKSDETYATKLLSTLQQLLKTVQSMKITDPYQAFEEEEVKPLLSQVRTYIDNPLNQVDKDLQKALNQSGFSDVTPTGTMDSATRTAITQATQYIQDRINKKLDAGPIPQNNQQLLSKLRLLLNKGVQLL